MKIDKGLIFEYKRGNISKRLENRIVLQLIQEKRFNDLSTFHKRTLKKETK